ncbi:hypothetical protein BUALT_Bualt16G0015200 [Buddleja alternifolia]|uniref:Sirohydrochlorin ferrochelatase n=1 Tax=Buddleja alternifolia TaxID=168488 RepID=A0AAV6WEG2_9LAMI|nr:hypothetical protein BUALT_Bualt16G0015200 [Buddleja alternifolia]
MASVSGGGGGFDKVALISSGGGGFDKVALISSGGGGFDFRRRKTLKKAQAEESKMEAASSSFRKEIYTIEIVLAAANGGIKKAIKGIGEGDGVIIVDHGSRRKESNLMLNDFVVMFQEKTKYPIVEPAHMELAEPSIKDAFSSCVQQGAQCVIVSPFFLFPGRHWHQDIPSLTAEAATEHPGISYFVTALLGLHELLVDVVNDRINHCLSHVAGEEDECSVCAGTQKCRVYNEGS